MTPFQEFRLWARRAPLGERVSAAVAGGVMLALLVWVLVPNNADVAGSSSAFSATGGQPNASSGGQLPAAAGSSAEPRAGLGEAGGSRQGASVTNPSSGGRRNGNAVAQRPAASSHARGCVSPPGGGTGVTDKQIKIAVLLVDLKGSVGNATFNIASTDLQKSSYQAVIDDVNASGGVACRRLVPEYYNADPTDQGNLAQVCLDVVESGAFAVLDPGAYAQSTEETCYAQHRIDYWGAYLLPESLRRKFYPYLFEFDTYDRIYHDTVFALKSRGFFDPANGFQKLGVPYRDCFPEEFDQTMTWLQQAGVSSSNIVSYDIGCPAALANPPDIEQAVLKFQRAGVTNVTGVQFTGDWVQFTRYAQQQGFHPKYGLADDQLVTTSYGTTAPNARNFNGAIAVAPNRDAEETTPGVKPTPATRRCDAILAKHGIKPTHQQPYAVGNACDQVWMFAAAVDHAPALQTNTLAAGLERAGSVDFSFPQGPNDFSGTGVTTGGQYYRFVGFTAACSCWRVIGRRFHRSTY